MPQADVLGQPTGMWSVLSATQVGISLVGGIVVGELCHSTASARLLRLQQARLLYHEGETCMKDILHGRQRLKQRRSSALNLPRSTAALLVQQARCSLCARLGKVIHTTCAREQFS